ncbi:MAG: CopD family protein [Cycloclasticus sp.]|nr:CopD family protein [Cycloclasticus sp.]
MIPLAISLHVLSAVIWVGGMFFAYLVLRPIAAVQFEPPQRLTLWSNVFSKFFPWVWVSVVLLLGTGFWLIAHKFGGMKNVAAHIHIMMSVGIIMTLLFMHLFFAPRRKLTQAVIEHNWEEAGKHLAQIRMLIGINLILGLGVVVVATGGRYLFT